MQIHLRLRRLILKNKMAANKKFPRGVEIIVGGIILNKKGEILLVRCLSGLINGAFVVGILDRAKR